MLLSIFAVQMLVKLRNGSKAFTIVGAEEDGSGTLRYVTGGEHAAYLCPLAVALDDAGKLGNDSGIGGTQIAYPHYGNEEKTSTLLGITPKDAETIMRAADNPNTPDGITLRSILCPSSSPLALKVVAQIPTSGYADRHKGVELVY